MKLNCVVGHVCETSNKLSDPKERVDPLLVVRLYTYPHVGDVELSNDALSGEERAAFAEWARTLSCGQEVVVELSARPKP